VENGDGVSNHSLGSMSSPSGVRANLVHSRPTGDHFIDAEVHILHKKAQK